MNCRSNQVWQKIQSVRNMGGERKRKGESELWAVNIYRNRKQHSESIWHSRYADVAFPLPFKEGHKLFIQQMWKGMRRTNYLGNLFGVSLGACRDKITARQNRLEEPDELGRDHGKQMRLENHPSLFWSVHKKYQIFSLRSNFANNWLNERSKLVIALL